MKLQKDNDVVELSDPIIIKAYINSGYEEVVKEPKGKKE